jgi:prephenate dehydrogenase
VTDLSGIVDGQDPERFREFFERNSRHLGSYCEEGQQITDALIESMVNR